MKSKIHIATGKCSGPGFFYCKDERYENCIKCKYYESILKDMNSVSGFEPKEGD